MQGMSRGSAVRSTESHLVNIRYPSVMVGRVEGLHLGIFHCVDRLACGGHRLVKV